ncbi:MAG: hypothetical protein JOZ87_02795 [Chloroflexi bacterium]|nr:hypothetical protein [Chloroflexota bacterium]
MKQPGCSGDVVLEVRNHHASAAGTPPRIIDDDPNQYIGYFENRFGEQALLVFNRGTRKAILYVGDAGWETKYTVIDGAAPDLILGEAELQWLRACWLAATGNRSSESG